MGYSGLKNVNCSDMASDLLSDCQEAFIKQLKKGSKLKENEFNTSGWINVALIVESGVLDNFDGFFLREVDWKFVVGKLEKEVEESSYKNKSDWEDEENRILHNTAFKRMLKNVKKFLDKKEINDYCD